MGAQVQNGARIWENSPRETVNERRKKVMTRERYAKTGEEKGRGKEGKSL